MKNLFSKIKVTAIVAVMSLFSVSSFAQLPQADYFDFDNGATEVDLGLPSGKIWATCNVGAESPWGLGMYFAWGETTGHYPMSGYDFHYSHPSTTTSTLTTSQDAANVNMGGTWRMPTKAEFEELLTYCKVEYFDYNSGRAPVPGILLTSKKNGNQIFFPGGKETSGTYFGLYEDAVQAQLYPQYNSRPQIEGHYWCANGYSKYEAYEAEFSYDPSDGASNKGIIHRDKGDGFLIRAIRTPLKPIITPTTGKIIPVTLGTQTYNKLAR